MKKGKSTYTLQLRCNSNTIKELMKNYITANGFTFIEKKRTIFSSRRPNDGVLVYAMDFYFAFQDLKTRKRRKTIATIILSIISISIVIIQLTIVANL